MYFYNNVPVSHLIRPWRNRIAFREQILEIKLLVGQKDHPVAEGIKRSVVNP
jgi:hypothetical protein